MLWHQNSGAKPLPLNSGAMAFLVPNSILLTWHHFWSLTPRVWHHDSLCSYRVIRQALTLTSLFQEFKERCPPRYLGGLLSRSVGALLFPLVRPKEEGVRRVELTGEGTPSIEEQFEGHISDMMSIINEHNSETKLTRPFESFRGSSELKGMAHASMVPNVSANAGRVGQGWFERLPPKQHRRLGRLREAFTPDIQPKVLHRPHEFTKIVRKANET
ncbi:hypothetical protein Tco_1525046 [Tanacetum coccineum]